MNIERAAMKGKLAEAKERRRKAVNRAEGLCSAIRQQLNTALTPVEDIEMDIVAEQMQSLVMAYADIIVENGKIARLEKELK